MCSLWLADSRFCFDGESLSPAFRDAGGESGGGDEVAAGKGVGPIIRLK